MRDVVVRLTEWVRGGGGDQFIVNVKAQRMWTSQQTRTCRFRGFMFTAKLIIRCFQRSVFCLQRNAKTK